MKPARALDERAADAVIRYLRGGLDVTELEEQLDDLEAAPRTPELGQAERRWHAFVEHALVAAGVDVSTRPARHALVRIARAVAKSEAR